MRKVRTNWIVPLLENSEIKVRLNDRVKIGQLLTITIDLLEEVWSMQGELLNVSAEVLTHINKQFQDQQILKGDVLFTTKGIFPKKVVAPRGGKFVRIDDDKNLHIIVDKNSKKVFSSVNSKVVELNNNQLVLEFEAMEILGRGLNNIRSWAYNGLVKINNLNEINYQSEGKIGLIKDLSSTMITKGVVVGLSGIVTLENCNLDEDGRINFKLPILMVSEENFAELENLDGSTQILLNGEAGRLLLVVEK